MRITTEHTDNTEPGVTTVTALTEVEQEYAEIAEELSRGSCTIELSTINLDGRSTEENRGFRRWLGF